MSFLKRLSESLKQPIVIKKTPFKSSFTIGNVIFLSRSDSNSANKDQLIEHEKIHVKQQSGLNSPWLSPTYYLRYAFDAKFRWKQERPAFEIQIKKLQEKNKNTGIGIDYRWFYNKIMNDYNKMVSSSEALEFIRGLQESDQSINSIRV